MLHDVHGPVAKYTRILETLHAWRRADQPPSLEVRFLSVFGVAVGVQTELERNGCKDALDEWFMERPLVTMQHWVAAADAA